MRERHAGFILIIVLGLLGVLACVVLELAQSSQIARILGKAQMDKSRSRIMARSGMERALRQCQEAMVYGGLPPLHSIAIGEGTHAAGGDRAEYSVHDASGAIDLNDGIAAGLAEWGPDLYQSDTLDWDATEPPPADPVPSGFVGCYVVHADPYDDTHAACYDPYLVEEGDILRGTAYPYDGIEFRVLYIDQTGLMQVDRSLDADANEGDHYFEVWKIPRYSGPLLARSRINVRLRTLLNAYGDVHKFLSEMGEDGSRYGTPFAYSSTTLAPFGHAMPSVDVRDGSYITDKTVARRWGRGLGDRVVCSRPPAGYRSIHEVEEIVDAWARETLMSGYLATRTFFDLIKGDIVVGNLPDPTYTRLAIQQRVSRLEPNCSEFGTRDVVQGSTYVPNMFSPMHIDMRPPNMKDMFKPHPVIPLNLSGASVCTRAAVLAALVNVGYLCEGSRSFLYDIHSSSYLGLAQNSIGVSGPVLRYPLRENGVEALPTMENGVPVTHAAQLFMSVHDAIEMSKGYVQYGALVGLPRTFDEFREFLYWHRRHGAGFEKCEPRDTPYNPDITEGGYFTDDYAALTLPHALSRVIRMPGYMGAPQALLSPAYVLTGYRWPGGIGPNDDDPTEYGQHAGTHPTRKAEDFVSRYLLPKVGFLPLGIAAVFCRGLILDSQGEELATTRIHAVARGFVTHHYLRSQKDFVDATDTAATSPSILIGPEAFRRNSSLDPNDPEYIQSRDYPHPYLGVVGLRDFEEPVVGEPQIMAHFNGHVSGDPGVSRIFAVSGDAGGFYQGYDPITGGYVGHDPVSTPYGHFEWATQPLFAEGAAGSNLSPFGGVWCSTLGNFPRLAPGTLALQKDALYWRPMNGFDPNTPLRGGFPSGGEAIGATAGKGYLSAWVRMPSAHEGVSDTEGDGTHVDIRMNFRTIAHFNVFESVATPANPGGATMISSIILGLGFDEVIQRYVILARYGTKNADPYCFGSMGAAQFGNPGLAGNNPASDYDNTMILSNYLSSSYADWRAIPFRSWYFNERWVVLRDPAASPESGAGTWHKISVGWNSHFHEQVPQKNFWLKVHDGSNVENQGMHNWNSKIGPPGVYSDFPNYHAHNVVFSLGAIFSLGYFVDPGTLGQCRTAADLMLPGEQQMEDLNGFVQGSEMVTHQLDSLVDNVTLQLGTDSLGLPPVETTAPPRRYDVSAEPEWVLDPNTFLEPGSRVVTLGARIYDPKDSAGNFPEVDLDLMEAGVPADPLAVVEMVPHGANQRTERLRFFGGHALGPGSRIRLKYRNHRPLGTPLIEDGTSDDWAEIPWIMEVMVRCQNSSSIQILGWRED